MADSGAQIDADTFGGPVPSLVFTTRNASTGYYPDDLWTGKKLVVQSGRIVTLRAGKNGLGLELEPTWQGFLVGSVGKDPGQSLQPGEVLCCIEGRNLQDLVPEQLGASFAKRAKHGARVVVCQKSDKVLEGWDAKNNCYYYFNQLTQQSAWTREEAEEGGPRDPLAPKKVAAEEALQGPAQADLAKFLQGGFNTGAQKRLKKRKVVDEVDPNDLAKTVNKRINDWNSEGGGYTSTMLQKYGRAHVRRGMFTGDVGVDEPEMRLDSPPRQAK
jgi:hypothetical protein